MKIMKKQNLLQVLMAMAVTFAVQTPAQAQLGGLMKKAKKVAEQTVKQTTGTEQGSASVNAGDDARLEKAQADYEKEHPAVQERKNAEAAGGMDKYLGLDQTESGRIIYKYFAMKYGEDGDNSSNRANARNAASTLVNILRYLKGNTEDFAGFDQPTHVLDMLNNRIPEQIKAMSKTGQYNKPLPQAEIDAFKTEVARVKQLYVQATGVKEKTAGELKAEADSKYVQDIVNQNYLLNDLTDKNRQAKAVADYKAKVDAKVKAALAPTKILGTYSTSVAWQGLPVFQMPELKEKYSSVQEMQFKTFYEKGGKYYVVKSAFRQSIDKGDNVHGAQPQKDYWPGLETPVEIPADKIQGKF